MYSACIGKPKRYGQMRVPVTWLLMTTLVIVGVEAAFGSNERGLSVNKFTVSRNEAKTGRKFDKTAQNENWLPGMDSNHQPPG